MFKKIHLQLFTILISTFVFTSCSKDEDNNNPSNTPSGSSDTPAEVSDPASLSEGGADFSAAGTETFHFTDANSIWFNSGALTFSDRTYSETDVTLRADSQDVYLHVIFFVHDQNADLNGGALPEPGTFDFDLGFSELTSENTESYAEVSVGGDDLDYYYDDNNSEGTIEITSFDGDILEGTVHLTGMTNSDNENVSLNVAASFKATMQ